MGRIAFVFSGQGDQHPGMGAGFHSRYDAARSVFELCDKIRPGTSKMCFTGENETLRQTENSQPCLFAMEMAAAQALESCGLRADMAAGFSLGELTALTYSGAMSLQAGFSLVCRRGQLMQRDAEKQNTSMAAVLRLDNEKVAELCSRYEYIYPVNYNCPGQVSVSGADSEMPEFLAAVKQAGGRAMPLKVRGAFHSPYMQKAAQDFGALLETASFAAPALPVYSDVTALPYEGDVAETLSNQMCAPVRWENIVRNMILDGADTFIEIGPGKTLSNLIGRIDSTVRTFAVSSYEDLDALVREVRSC